jgi:trehalose-phosphatase
MEVLNAHKNPSHFFEELRKRPNRALLLDYDGTLAPFKRKGDIATSYPEVTRIVEDISHKGKTRVVIISTMALDDLIPLLEWQSLPEIWGTHGAERRFPDGTRKTAPLKDPSARALRDAVAYLAGMGWGDHLEENPFGVILHWRSLKPAEGDKMKETLLQYLAKQGAEADLDLKEFDGGLELRAPEGNRAQALKAILSEMPEDTALAYLGDDLTDEDAFVFLHQQETARIGILVKEELRETKADFWLRPAPELLSFLKNWRAATIITKRKAAMHGPLST